MIVADTHAFIWWAHDRNQLSVKAERTLEAADRILISAITGWEIALLVSKGRLDIGADPLIWILEALARTHVEVVPLPLEAAVRSVELQQLRDPGDQMIVATAMDLGLPLVTKDQRIRDSGLVATIW